MAKRMYANERKNNIFEKKVMPENNIYYATLKTRHGLPVAKKISGYFILSDSYYYSFSRYADYSYFYHY